MAVPKAAGPTRAPTSIEDFLWNIHSVLVATPGPLALDNLKEAYSKHLGHKCIIERFLVVGEGGPAATLKRIPHMVTLFHDDKGTLCVKATQPADTTKQQLIDADSAYRRELIKKNAAAKAKAGAAAKAQATPKGAGGATAAATGATPASVAPDAGAKAQSPTAVGDKRPPGDVTATPDAKKPRTGDSDAETLARMLVQGVVRVLQNRAKAGKGALPIGELEDEFKALWKVPFNLQQAGEKDAVSFLQKWPNKVELHHDGAQQLVQLPKSKPKAAPGATPEEAAVKKASDGGAPAKVAAGANVAKPPPAAKVPAAPAPGGGVPPTKGPPAKGPPVSLGAQGGAAANGPSRPPASIEDFLWNIHTVIDSYGGPMPLDQLKEVYSKRLGHKCVIERFLVVGDGGLGATLKRIPHVVTVEQTDGVTMLTASLPQGTTKEGLIAADHQYRRQLAQKNAAAKAKAASGSVAAGASAIPAAAAANAATDVSKAPAAAAPGAAQARPAAELAPGEKDPKKPRGEEADTLARMLVQGVVRVLQNRQKEGKGPLLISSLEEEFKALWKVPFNLQQAGETDAVSFLSKWPNKVEVVKSGISDGGVVVQLAKKAAEKAKASAPAAAPVEPATPAVAASASQATGATAPAGTAAALESALAEATSNLEQMQECVRRQEGLVSHLRRLSDDLKQ